MQMFTRSIYGFHIKWLDIWLISKMVGRQSSVIYENWNAFNRTISVFFPSTKGQAKWDEESKLKRKQCFSLFSFLLQISNKFKFAARNSLKTEKSWSNRNSLFNIIREWNFSKCNASTLILCLLRLSTKSNKSIEFLGRVLSCIYNNSLRINLKQIELTFFLVVHLNAMLVLVSHHHSLSCYCLAEMPISPIAALTETTVIPIVK